MGNMGFGFTPFLVFAFVTKLSSNVVVIVLRGILCRQFQKFMTTIEFNLCTVKNIWVNYHGLPKKKLAFTDHLVIFTIFGGWVGPPHYKNSKKLLSDQ